MLNRVALSQKAAIPAEDFCSLLMVWLNVPQIWEQITRRNTRFSPEIETAGYPSYYLQTSITRRIAALVIYPADISTDLQVVFLFGGSSRCSGDPRSVAG